MRNQFSRVDKGKRHLIRAVFTPILFELCGIIPLLLVSFGLLNVSAGIALRNILVFKYGFIFYIIATAFFIYSVYLFLKERRACNVSGLKKHKQPIIVAFLVLSIFEGVILFLIQIAESMIYRRSLTYFTDFFVFAPFLLFILFAFILWTKLHRDKDL